MKVLIMKVQMTKIIKRMCEDDDDDKIKEDVTNQNIWNSRICRKNDFDLYDNM